MSTLWANRNDTLPDILERVQVGLKVDMIMTPRAELETCRLDQLASSVVAQNDNHYSFFPVVDDEAQVVGLFDAEQWCVKQEPQEQIGKCFKLLSEDMVIGAETSIIDFVREADKRPVQLVVSQQGVRGLVGLSDIQKLPARTAFFTLLTRLEMAMAQWIDQNLGANGATGWLKLLNSGQRSQIAKDIEKAESADCFVSEIACTNLRHKMTVLKKKWPEAGCGTDMCEEFEEIYDFRNAIAHANYFAELPSTATNVCKTVKSIERFIGELFASL